MGEQQCTNGNRQGTTGRRDRQPLPLPALQEDRPAFHDGQPHQVPVAQGRETERQGPRTRVAHLPHPSIRRRGEWHPHTLHSQVSPQPKERETGMHTGRGHPGSRHQQGRTGRHPPGTGSMGRGWSPASAQRKQPVPQGHSGSRPTLPVPQQEKPPVGHQGCSTLCQ